MKRVFLRMTSTALAIVLTASLLAACSGQKVVDNGVSNEEASTASSETVSVPAVKLSLINASNGRVIKEDDPIAKEIGSKTNTILEVTLVTTGEYINKLNMLVASGSLPDISVIYGYDIFNYIPQGVLMDITNMVEKYGPNINKETTKEAWDIIKSEGKIYGVPKLAISGKTNAAIRKDWLDTLGLKVPDTIDEYTDMLYKFTTEDPDRNGKNDTYGFGLYAEADTARGNYATVFGNIFGMFGAMPGKHYLKDGKVYNSSISNEYRDAVEYLAKLYKDKVIDQDLFIMKTDQARQYLAQGRSGSFYGWWSSCGQVLMDQMKMKEVNPEAEWITANDIKGRNGNYGLNPANRIAQTMCISSNCKNPEAAVGLIDFLLSDEGTMIANLGVEGVHWTKKSDGGFSRTEEGNKAMSEKWVDIFYSFMGKKDFVYTLYENTTPEYIPNMDSAAKARLYYDLFEGISTDDANSLKPDVIKVENEWFIKFVTGKEPISKWDEYVKQYNEKGGKEITASLLKEYNTRRGMEHVIGN